MCFLSACQINRNALGYVGLDVVVVKIIIILVEAAGTESSSAANGFCGLGSCNNNASLQIDLCICCVRMTGR